MHLQLARCQDPASHAVSPSRFPARADGRRNLATAAPARPGRHWPPGITACDQCDSANARRLLREENAAESPGWVPLLRGAVTVVVSTYGEGARPA